MLQGCSQLSLTVYEWPCLALTANRCRRRRRHHHDQHQRRAVLFSFTRPLIFSHRHMVTCFWWDGSMLNILSFSSYFSAESIQHRHCILQVSAIALTIVNGTSKLFLVAVNFASKNLFNLALRGKKERERERESSCPMSVTCITNLFFPARCWLRRKGLRRAKTFSSLPEKKKEEEKERVFHRKCHAASLLHLSLLRWVIFLFA